MLGAQTPVPHATKDLGTGSTDSRSG